MAKTSRRLKLQALEEAETKRAADGARIKHEAASARQCTSTPATTPTPPQTLQQPRDSPVIKTERRSPAAASVQPPEPINNDMQALSIAEPVAPNPQPRGAPTQPPDAATMVKQEQLRPSAPQRQPTRSSHQVVDLTEDDDDEEPESAVHTSNLPRVKREQHRSATVAEPVSIKDESSAWLASVSSSSAELAHDALAHDEFTSFADDDPIMTTMISEYNRMSESIFNLEREIASVQVKLKELVAKPDSDMNEVVRCSNVVAQVKNHLVKETHNRNAVVARLVIYLKQAPTDLEALFDASTTDIAHVQVSSHRKCAQFEASIREKRHAVRSYKRSIEEAISMKSKDAYTEVARLGAMVVANEQAIRELEDARLAEFLLLFQFSQQIRNAARNMTSIQAP